MAIDTGDVRDTACPLDCPDACSLSVTVTDGRITSVDAGARNPATKGVICGKVRNIARHVYGDERVHHPLIRRGPKGSGAFERVSWEDALSEITRRFSMVVDAHGAEAILPISYGGSNGFLTQDNVDARFFRRLGTSRLARTVCAAPTGAAASGLYGRMVGVPFEDYLHAELIVVWGTNPSATGIHLVPILHEARRKGAKLVVVDPRRTPLAKSADLHVAPRPGTDLPIALSIIRALFVAGGADRAFLDAHATGADVLAERADEWTFPRASAESGVPVDVLERFYAWYRAATPAVIRCGWGPERNRNGGSATAAILALPAVGGKFGVGGGGYTLSNSAAWGMRGDAAARAEEPATRIVNMNRIGRVLTEGDPPVHAVFVYNANPVVTLPNQNAVLEGFLREDLFTVVFDAVHTDTAALADVVLPATTFLEHDEMSRGYGTVILHRSRPVIEPVGEARPNADVFAELCRRMELSRPEDPESPDALAEAVLGTSPNAARVSEALLEDSRAFPSGREASPVVQFETVFPGTPDGKVHLLPADLDREAPLGLYGYQADPARDATPLALISPATSRTVSSTFGQLDDRPAVIELHPEDAAARDIADGDEVEVVNELGVVRCTARVRDAVRPGVCTMSKGLWRRHTRNGLTSNALCPDTLTDVGAGACFNDARVEVRRTARS